MTARAVGLVVVIAAAAGLAAGGCRPESEYDPFDLSTTAIFCPSDPPAADDYVCDPTAIPYCTYPAQQLTCRCTLVDRGRTVLVCPRDLGSSDDASDGRD